MGSAVKWQPEMVERLRQFPRSASVQEIAAVMGRSVREIRRKQRAIGIRRNFKWSADKVSQLESLAGTMPQRAIAELLGCTCLAVQTQMHLRKISNGGHGNRWQVKKPAPAKLSHEEISEMRRANALRFHQEQRDREAQHVARMLHLEMRIARCTAWLKARAA